jgi:hypothetical protein
MKETIKKLAVWGGMIGISAGSIATVFIFALDSYIGQVVDQEIDKHIAQHVKDHPLLPAINGELTVIKDGIDDNTNRLIEIKRTQENFELLFMEYLQNEANR